MSVQRWVVGVLVFGSLLTQEVSAQDKAVSFQVRGGSFHGISHLNDAHTADLQKRGFNAGAGLNVELTRYFALRGDVNLARNELELNNVETGRDLSRLFYDASLQFQYPITENFKPYIFVGAGAVTLHPTGTDDGDKTTFAGTGGLGITYTIPGTGLGIGVEGKSWLYQFKDVGGQFAAYDKLQFDATWGATLSYRIPLGAPVVRASR
jgi:hypothetical protein